MAYVTEAPPTKLGAIEKPLPGPILNLITIQLSGTANRNITEKCTFFTFKTLAFGRLFGNNRSESFIGFA